jgi:hypothetical protein
MENGGTEDAPRGDGPSLKIKDRKRRAIRDNRYRFKKTRRIQVPSVTRIANMTANGLARWSTKSHNFFYKRITFFRNRLFGDASAKTLITEVISVPASASFFAHSFAWAGFRDTNKIIILVSMLDCAGVGRSS